MSIPGRLIVIEGPDGVGKTTLAAALVAKLNAQGLPCQQHSFPGRQPLSLGSLVYTLHHDPAAANVTTLAPAALQAMHIAAHLDAIERIFIPRLLDGEHIVIDRYWWSTFVYGVSAGVSSRLLERLIEAERLAWGDHAPLIVFLVDRAKPWRVAEETPFWHRLADAYRALGARERLVGRVELLSNDDPAESVATRMATSVVALLGSPPPEAAHSTTDQLRLSLSPVEASRRTSDVTISLGRIRALKGSPVLDTYWRFAAERQEVYFRRLDRSRPPWTDDHILQRHRFTNAYRAADRVSQYLIRHVIYEGDQSPNELFFRILLFKLFNRIETWELLQQALGKLVASEFAPARYSAVLQDAMAAGQRVYSGAYIMPAAPGGAGVAKHVGHLHLLDGMLRDDLPQRLADSRSLRQAFELLRSYPMMGDFLAFQYVIDLNYSALWDFSEMEFVVPGPGARSGIQKCFVDRAGLSEADLIRLVSENQSEEFARRGIVFRSLWGRSLQLVDCQNVFCEVDKYARVAHPTIGGQMGRKRIKQVLRPGGPPASPWYPPKWGLNEIIELEERGRDARYRGNER